MAEHEKEIFRLAQQLFGQPKPTSEMPSAQPVLPQAPEVEASPENTDSPKVRETRTAAELAQMIEEDLTRHPECPRTGFVVTVYGATFWRAMLTIKPAAGPVRDPQEWRDLTEELAERLRKRYDLAGDRDHGSGLGDGVRD